MAGVINIDMKGIDQVLGKLKGLEKRVVVDIDNVLSENTKQIASTAKELAPADIGGLRSSISANTGEFMRKHVTVNAFYGPFMEFGTGAYAASYVGSLPADWQAFAASYHGQKGEGTAYDFYLKLIEWVKRNSQYSEGAVTGRHSEKTGRRKGAKPVQQAENEAAAYLIMRAIFRHGLKPRRFLYRAYDQQRAQIKRDVEAVLKAPL